MIEFLSDWMRGLILIIFLAVFLDMVLPNEKMQRYSRVVMGLLVILMMMNPVLKLFGTSIYEMDFSVDKIFAPAQQSNSQQLADLDAIQAQADKLGLAGQNQMTDQFRAAVGEQIKQNVEQDHGTVRVQKVEVLVAQDAAGKPQHLDGITLYLTPRDEPGAAKPVQPVEPVIIGKEPDLATKREPTSEALKQEASEIRTRLASEYQLSKQKITIFWDGI